MKVKIPKHQEIHMKIPPHYLKQYCYFSRFSEDALEELSEKFYVVDYPAGTDIIHEGEPGDAFYFVNKGKVKVVKKNPMEQSAVLSLLGQGDVFGEMALITSSRRFATVTAETDVILFKLYKSDFEHCVLVDSTVSHGEQMRVDGYNQFNKIKTLEPFALLQPHQMAVLLTSLVEREYKGGENIVHQGEAGDDYHIIKSGRVVVLKQMLKDEPEKIAVLAEGMGFGEEALLTGARRSATVQALEDVVTWTVSRTEFERVLKSSYLEEVPPEEVPFKKIGRHALLDVRTRMEFEDERIPGAINVPLDELRLKYSDLDPKRKYFVYCLVGARSAIAAFLLKMHGFKAKSVRGGLLKWEGPLEKGNDGIHTPSTPT